MKRKEIYVAVIIDTISQNDSGDDAYIFNTKKRGGGMGRIYKKEYGRYGMSTLRKSTFYSKSRYVNRLLKSAGLNNKQVR